MKLVRPDTNIISRKYFESFVLQWTLRRKQKNGANALRSHIYIYIYIYRLLMCDIDPCQHINSDIIDLCCINCEIISLELYRITQRICATIQRPCSHVFMAAIALSFMVKNSILS
jgi:hypothetical protein